MRKIIYLFLLSLLWFCGSCGENFMNRFIAGNQQENSESKSIPLKEEKDLELAFNTSLECYKTIKLKGGNLSNIDENYLDNSDECFKKFKEKYYTLIEKYPEDEIRLQIKYNTKLQSQ